MLSLTNILVGDSRAILMKPAYYSDIDLSRKNLMLSASVLFKVLHSIFSNKNGVYAVALPEMIAGGCALDTKIGTVVRLFSESAEYMEIALDEVETRTRMFTVNQVDLNFKIGRVKKIPEDYHGPLAAFHRFRVAPRRGSNPDHAEKQMRLRMSGLEKAKTLPYIKMHSTSTGQGFSLFIRKSEYPGFHSGVNSADSGSSPTGVDSYGFSPASNPLYLPVA